MIVVLEYLDIIACQWKTEWNSRLFRIKLLLVPLLFLVYSWVSQQLSHYIQLRRGTSLNDRLLSLLPRIDFSVEIFLLLYSSMILLLLTHLHRPAVILRVVEMHFLVAVVRQICILIVALEPPPDIIVIRDVFLENTIYPPEVPMTKDLFFSGHVASIWIYFLCARPRYLKVYLIFVTLIMSLMVLSMRVHYTYDVYGGLFFTTVIYFFLRKITVFCAAAKQRVN